MDQATRIEIDTITSTEMKEAGILEPPVSIEELLDHLKLDREFYDLEDPSLLRTFWHKVRCQPMPDSLAVSLTISPGSLSSKEARSLRGRKFTPVG